MDGTLYLDPPNYDGLLATTLGELRASLGVPREGQADQEARLHRRDPIERDREIPAAIGAGKRVPQIGVRQPDSPCASPFLRKEYAEF